MELNLVTKFPILVAIDEFNSLYWPTAIYYDGLPIPAHQLTLAKAFRFVDSIPGDIEDDNNPKTIRHAKLNPLHLPKRGIVLGATTRSIEAEKHDTQLTPCRFEQFNVKDVDYIEISKYNQDEFNKALMWYINRNLFHFSHPNGVIPSNEIGMMRAITGGFPDKLALWAENRHTKYIKI
jgi:hypothetical protein